MPAAPYRKVVQEAPRVWSPWFHVINLRKPGVRARRADGSTNEFSPLSMCPCTPQTTKEQLAYAEQVTGISPYVGGRYCCGDGSFVTDTSKECARADCSDLPTDSFRFKLTVVYEDATPRTRGLRYHRDALGLAKHDEFDVPRCAKGTPPDHCVPTTMYVEQLGPYVDGVTHATLHVAQPHLHTGALSILLQDALTNRTLCSASRANGWLVYGRGFAPGNESGYLVGVQRCAWGADDAPRFAIGHPLRTVATYEHRVVARRRQWGAPLGLGVAAPLLAALVVRFDAVCPGAWWGAGAASAGRATTRDASRACMHFEGVVAVTDAFLPLLLRSTSAAAPGDVPPADPLMSSLSSTSTSTTSPTAPIILSTSSGVGARTLGLVSEEHRAALLAEDLDEEALRRLVQELLREVNEDEAHPSEGNELPHLEVASLDVSRKLAGGATETQAMRSRVVRSGLDRRRME